ncbi:MAG: alpha/beta hydrolase [Desulfatibacillum sp.]|nr:alpha/beta hydrolase [Desulfatibacillum sp.]
MKNFVRAAVLVLLVLLIPGCISKLVYHPTRDFQYTPQDIGLAFEEVFLESTRGNEIHGWYVPCQNARATVLFCHGNAGNISHRISHVKIFHDLSLSLLIFDYQGFGKSQGNPSEQATYDDARAGWDFLVKEKGALPEDIVIFGKSLGGAIAIELAAEVQPGALFVDSSFTSTYDVAKAHYGWAPRFLLRNYPYDSISRISKLQAPVCFFHSQLDDVIPYEQGVALFQAAPEPKAFVELSGSHNDGFVKSLDLYSKAIDAFIKEHMEDL